MYIMFIYIYVSTNCFLSKHFLFCVNIGNKNVYQPWITDLKTGQRKTFDGKLNDPSPAGTWCVRSVRPSVLLMADSSLDLVNCHSQRNIVYKIKCDSIIYPSYIIRVNLFWSLVQENLAILKQALHYSMTHNVLKKWTKNQQRQFWKIFFQYKFIGWWIFS